jgi:hypothetical protein
MWFTGRAQLRTPCIDSPCRPYQPYAGHCAGQLVFKNKSGGGSSSITSAFAELKRALKNLHPDNGGRRRKQAHHRPRPAPDRALKEAGRKVTYTHCVRPNTATPSSPKARSVCAKSATTSRVARDDERKRFFDAGGFAPLPCAPRPARRSYAATSWPLPGVRLTV